MAGALYVKAGVSFDVIAPAGFRILSALDTVARALDLSLTITSACDGVHSGPNDPHKLGCAYDVRSKSLFETDKARVLDLLLRELGDHLETPKPVSIGYAITRFYAQLEHPGTDIEHLHVQLRHGQRYPV